MTYYDQWNALSSRIRGLMKAAELHTRFLAIQSSDSYRVGVRLRDQSEDILSAIQIFQERFQHALPPGSLVSIDSFRDRVSDLINDTSGGPGAQQERVWAALVLLGAFETEMSFILSDIQQSIRARSERAFSHLQRSIVADVDFRGKWQNAFEQGEVQCEKLGAVHLLLHGIWAFKVDAEGGRTDLVFQEPAWRLTEEQRYVEGIVLTEWKKANSQEDAVNRFEDARNQAHRYAEGVLAGNELTAYRYAVVVTRKQVPLPDDLTVGGVVYRHINLAVEPLTPSRA